MSGTVSSSLSSLTNTAASTKVNSNGTTSAASALNFDSNEWLTLLTTELQYQDPTAPSDPTQFVAQLAQFSAVSQQVTTNTTLNTISSQLTANSLGESAAMIGKTVQGSAGDYVVPSSGTGPTSNYSFAVTNTVLKDVHVQITNASGSVVGRTDVSGTGGSVSYSGTSTNGTKLGAGSYTMALVGTDSNGATQTAGTLTTTGVIKSVLQNTSGTEYELDTGATVSASTVTEISNGS